MKKIRATSSQKKCKKSESDYPLTPRGGGGTVDTANGCVSRGGAPPGGKRRSSQKRGGESNMPKGLATAVVQLGKKRDELQCIA